MWYLAVHVSFKEIINTEQVTTTGIFRSFTERMLMGDELDKVYSMFLETICEIVIKFTSEGCGG